MQIQAARRLQHPVQLHQPRGHHHQIGQHLVLADKPSQRADHLGHVGRGVLDQLEVGELGRLVPMPGVLKGCLLYTSRAIPHVEIIRIGSRVPVFLPMRVTPEFCDMLDKYHPFWLNIHVNHPKEITPELAAAADRLTRAGVPLGNQSVLLAGVNDSVHIQRKLVHDLVKIRVRPYYLYQCDLVEGSGHLRTTVSKGIEIIEGLRGHTSGYAVPQYVVDAPGGGGKIPVMPNYVISQAPGKVVLRNFEGFITTYTEPLDYDPHEICLLYTSRCV